MDKNSMTPGHVPVLMKEICALFKEIEVHTFVDGTLGAGGHAEALLSQHPELQRYVGIDQDVDARREAGERLSEYQNRLLLVAGNFGDLSEIAERESIESVDGILLDLGVSSMQLDRGDRGFSFRQSGPLDMRMDREAGISAHQLVMEASEQELGQIFRDYGEERRWRQAARRVVQARRERDIATTGDLVEVLSPVFPSPEAAKRRGHSHPLTRCFQGLRIAVNGELEVLERVLPVAIQLLRPGGLLVVISYHSLEDRIVKNRFRDSASDKYDTSGRGGMFLDKDPEVRLLTRKPIVAGEEEIATNPRARSAKMRVVAKL